MSFWDRWVQRILSSFLRNNSEGVDAACELYQLAYELGLLPVATLDNRSLAAIVLACDINEPVGIAATAQFITRAGGAVGAGGRPAWHWTFADQLIELCPRNLDDLIDLFCQRGPHGITAFEAIELHLGTPLLRLIEALSVLVDKDGQYRHVDRTFVTLLIYEALRMFCAARQDLRTPEGQVDFSVWLYRHVICSLSRILEMPVNEEPTGAPVEVDFMNCSVQLGRDLPTLPWLVFLMFYGCLGIDQVAYVFGVDLPLIDIQNEALANWRAVLECMAGV